MDTPPSRRRFLASAGALALGACSTVPLPERGPVAAMFPGRIDDGGFMQSAYQGLQRIERDLAIPVRHVDRVPAERETIVA